MTSAAKASDRGRGRNREAAFDRRCRAVAKPRFAAASLGAAAAVELLVLCLLQLKKKLHVTTVRQKSAFQFLKLPRFLLMEMIAELLVNCVNNTLLGL